MKVKALSHISLLALLFTMPAFAGPSDGGGNNVSANDGELTDFVKFDQSCKDARVINPRTAKLPQTDQAIYATVKPIIDHMEDLYPGFGASKEEAFDKPWMVINGEFPSRNAEEKKVISQTSDAIYLSRAWLKTASREKIQEAYVHELVRHVAFKMLTAEMNTAALKAYAVNPEAQKREDDLKELLTPAVFKKFPQGVFHEIMDNAGDMIAKSRTSQGLIKAWNYPNVKTYNLQDTYDLIGKYDLAKQLKVLCQDKEDFRKT
jgi:hypothetical protein